MKRFAWMVLAASAAFCQTPSIDNIMARVAANQEKSVEARKQFVYRQNELVRMLRSGKMECEQRREYTVTPSATGIERHLVTSPEKNGDVNKCNFNLSSDSGSMSASTGSETDSFSTSMGKTDDGIPRGLFPLTAGEQRLYQYKLEGTERFHDRPVYRISFRPNRKKDPASGEGIWKGEALIDAEEFQPVQVVTDLTAKVPLPVRVLLGTNVHGIGFTVSYQRVADGVWFPAGFGGEFEVRALFFFKYTVSINVKNSDFRHTDVNSNVTYAGK